MNKHASLWWRLAGLALLLPLVLFALPQSAQAQWIAAGDTIPLGQVVDNDVLLTGTDVVVDGTVLGDVLAVGSTVTINGTVEGSLVAVGRTVAVNGAVGGSAYVLSRTLTLGSSASVVGNAHFVGLLLDSKSGSRIDRDLVVGSLRARVSGEIGRALRALILVLTFDGKIGQGTGLGMEHPATGSTPEAEKTSLSPTAVQDGSTLLFVSLGGRKAAGYAAPLRGDLAVAQLQNVGDQSASLEGVLPEWLVARLGEFLTLLIVGGLAVWLIPRRLDGWGDKLRTKPLPSFGYGLLAVAIFVNAMGIGILLAVLILLTGIWLGGVSLWTLAFLFWGIAYSVLGLALSVFALTVFFGSKVIVAYLAGKAILGRVAPRVVQYRILLLLLGLVLYVLLRSIPTLGWVFEVLIVILGLGAIWVTFRDGRLPAAAAESESE
jgi:cytoskeletal protein CcmA (bactofilin family)